MNPLVLGFAILGGLGVVSVFYALAVPRIQFRRAQHGTLMEGIQVTLAQAGLETTVPEFLTWGALTGGAMGLLTSLVLATPVVFVPFFTGGFFFHRVALEDKRNRRVNQYHHDLATVMGIIVNAWKIEPSLAGALRNVMTYGPGAGDGPEGAPQPGSVAEDFAEIYRVTRTGTALRAALQAVAERRRSPIFDGLATALLVAEEQGSQAGAMLERQRVITRRQVDTFNEALARQRNARGEVRNGTLGPWVILLLVQLLGQGAGSSGVDTVFFRTPLGALVALGCAVLTIGGYVLAMRLAGRGLLLTRVPTEYGVTKG